MKRYLLTLFIIFLLNFCFGQDSTKIELRLKEFQFTSIFGTKSTDSNTTYCILGTGFFRTPRSKNSDSLMTSWITNHAGAIVIPISSFGPTEINKPNSKMVFCWIIDKQDTLNNYLVRNGCFPGGTMQRPKTWEEMEKWEKDLYEGTNEKPNTVVLIKKEAYEIFLEQIANAETYSKANKMGIWATVIKDE
jgi:hypothetical protein